MELLHLLYRLYPFSAVPKPGVRVRLREKLFRAGMLEGLSEREQGQLIERFHGVQKGLTYTFTVPILLIVFLYLFVLGGDLISKAGNSMILSAFLLLGAFMPELLVRYLELRIKEYVSYIQKDIPDACRQSYSWLSAGETVEGVCEKLASSDYDLLSSEFGKIVSSMRSGQDLPDSLRHASERISSEQFKRMLAIFQRIAVEGQGEAELLSLADELSKKIEVELGAYSDSLERTAMLFTIMCSVFPILVGTGMLIYLTTLPIMEDLPYISFLIPLSFLLVLILLNQYNKLALPAFLRPSLRKPSGARKGREVRLRYMPFSTLAARTLGDRKGMFERRLRTIEFSFRRFHFTERASARAEEYLGYVLALSFTLFILSLPLMLINLGSILISLLILLLPPVIAYAYPLSKFETYVKTLERQFGDALYEFATAESMLYEDKIFQIATDRNKTGPIVREFKRIYTDIGRSSFDEALESFAERVESEKIKRAVRMLAFGYEAGADIGRILKELAYSFENALLLGDKIKAISSKVRWSILLAVVVVPFSIWLFTDIFFSKLPLREINQALFSIAEIPVTILSEESYAIMGFWYLFGMKVYLLGFALIMSSFLGFLEGGLRRTLQYLVPILTFTSFFVLII